MKYKKFIVLFILIFYLLINVGSADELPNNARVNAKNIIPWTGETLIITPFNDTAQIEVIIQMHPINNLGIFSDSMYNIPGTLVSDSDIEFYIDNEKKNFNEFFVVEIEKGMFRIKQKKILTINKSTDFRVKLYAKLPPEFISFDKNTTSVKFQTDFNLKPSDLFRQYIFRVPAVNAHNVKLNFQNSRLIAPNNSLNSAPVSEVYATDKYIDVSYVFWNTYLLIQVVLDEGKISVGLTPNTNYIFQNFFSIEYETIRWEWVIMIVVFSIVATFAFYRGVKWGEREKE
ncbi:MAG: hypothetical protein WC568_00025 [Candidatus Methanoperedens sp.]